MNSTLSYYQDNSDLFANSTQTVTFLEAPMKFLGLLSEGSRILDFGCGAGRDTKFFLDHGFAVDAVDGSEAMCKIASEYVGVPVRKMLFHELDAKNCYDGIWACASILHLPKNELVPVLQKMTIALKEDGVLYTSFKYGTFEGYRGDRYFTDFDEDSFAVFINENAKLHIIDQWITNDVRPGRGEEKWLNLLLKK